MPQVAVRHVWGPPTRTHAEERERERRTHGERAAAAAAAAVGAAVGAAAQCARPVVLPRSVAPVLPGPAQKPKENKALLRGLANKLYWKDFGPADKYLRPACLNCNKKYQEAGKGSKGTAISTLFWTISDGCLGALPPHTRRVL